MDGWKHMEIILNSGSHFICNIQWTHIFLEPHLGSIWKMKCGSITDQHLVEQNDLTVRKSCRKWQYYSNRNSAFPFLSNKKILQFYIKYEVIVPTRNMSTLNFKPNFYGWVGKMPDRVVTSLNQPTTINLSIYNIITDGHAV